MVQDGAQITSALKEIGLLNHLTPEELTVGENRIAQLDNTSPVFALEVIKAFPNTVFSPEQDEWKLLRESPIHPDVLKKLKEISHGQFTVPVDKVAIHRWGKIYAVNQTLAELDSDDRFYWINYPDDGENGPLRGWSIVFLSYSQFKVLNQKKIFNLNAPYSWTLTRINDVIDTLRELGLLILSEAEIEVIKQDILNTEIDQRSLPILLDSFGLVNWVDGESIYDVSEDYTNIIVETSRLSQGIFAPDGIQVLVDSDYQQITFSFTFEGQLFSKQVEYRGDWINWDYLVLMNEALANSDKNNRFCLIESEDQTAQIIFLNGNQLSEIQDKNLLPLVDWWDPLRGEV
ncbi:MAG: hypothetical protein GY797_02370 [Deltaproteobacteria bacterium]|nr:hypothetical protein [Deltaproteobacteria bacterium]